MAAEPPHSLAQCDRIDLQSWIDAIGVATVIGDVLPDGTVQIVASNDRFTAEVGAAPAGCHPEDIIDGPAGLALGDMFRRSVESGGNVEGEVEIWQGTRRQRCRVTIRPTRGRAARVARIVAVVVDRSGDQMELDRCHRALSEVRTAGRAVLDYLDIATIQISADGVLLHANRCAAEWLECGPRTLIGRRIEAVLGDEAGSAAAALLDAAITSGNSRTADVSLNGRMLRMTVDPIRSTGGALVAASVVARDVTAERHSELAAADHSRQLARCQRIASLAESTATIAHEMAQPLAAVVAYCRGAAARFKNLGGGVDHSELADALSAACHEAERAGAILRSIEGFVRPSPGPDVGTDLCAAILEVRDLLQVHLDRANITLTIDLPDSLPALAADPVEVAQVLHNLLRNAIDALDGQHAARISISARRERDAVVVTVDDTGSGFPEALGDDLFTPFATTKPGGLGMGLAICRSIVERHGGKIAADDAPGGGARIRFTLPLEEISRVA